MNKSGIKSYIPTGGTGTERKSKYGKFIDNSEFKYDENLDIYICPNNKKLNYGSYVVGRGYKRYRAKTSDCKYCPLKDKCIGSARSSKMIERHLYTGVLKKQKDVLNTPEYYHALKQRKIWCEGNFAHQKEQHNLRRTFKRGIEKVAEQCLLSACALNLKRLVKAM